MNLLGGIRRLFPRRKHSTTLTGPPKLEALEERCLLSWKFDPTFTGTGLPAGHVFEPNSGEASAVLLQPDRKILLGGWSSNDGKTYSTIFRMLPNGQPDPTFGSGGTVRYQFYASTVFQSVYTMTLQPWDNAIVVAGIASPGPGQSTVFALMRFLPNGEVDESFGGFNGDEPGKVSLRFENDQGEPADHNAARAIAIQDDQKIVIAGKADFDLDTSVGDEFAIARLHNNGALDSSFGDGGQRVFGAREQDEFHAMLLLPPDGVGEQKILVAGKDRASLAEGFDIIVARLLPDGQTDQSFAPDSAFPGIRIIDFGPGHSDIGFSMVRQPNDGKIVVAGLTNYLSEFGDSFGDFAVIRLDPEGTLDPSFGSGGLATADFDYFDTAFGVGLQRAGTNANKIVVAGYSLVPDVGLKLTGARFHTDGSVEQTFVDNFTGTGGHGDQARGLAIQPWDDKIVAGGFHTTDQAHGFAAVRLCADPPQCRRPIALPLSDGDRPDAPPSLFVMADRNSPLTNTSQERTTSVAPIRSDNHAWYPARATRLDEPRLSLAGRWRWYATLGNRPGVRIDIAIDLPLSSYTLGQACELDLH